MVLELEVNVVNKEGKAFWRNLGFFPVRIIRKYYSDGGDALRLRKGLMTPPDPKANR